MDHSIQDEGAAPAVPPQDDQDVRDIQTVDEEGLPPPVPEGKEFRLQAQQYLLTYSQIGEWTHHDIYGALCQVLSLKGIAISRAIYCQEHHKDGGRHVHLLIRLNRKPNLRGQSVLDVKLGSSVFHPNIRPVTGKKEAELRTMAYVMKGGNFIDSGYKEVHMRRITGFVRFRADIEAYEDHCRASNLTAPPTEIRLPGGISPVVHLDGGRRRRHILLYGSAFAGKTSSVDRCFTESNCFSPSIDPKSRYEGYMGQSVIFFNDCIPTFHELVALCDVRPFRVKVPGFTRYRNTYFAAGSVRVVIIVLNVIPDYGSYALQHAFATRFSGYEFFGSYPGIVWVKERHEVDLLRGYKPGPNPDGVQGPPFIGPQEEFRRYVHDQGPSGETQEAQGV